MWKRIIYSEWAEIVPYLAFFLTFGVFLILTVRALLMRKSKAKRMAHLPLEDEPGEASTTSNDNCSNRGRSDTDNDESTRADSPHVHSDRS